MKTPTPLTGIAFALATALALAGCAATENTTSSETSAEGKIGNGGTVTILVNPSGSQTFAPYLIDSLDLDDKYGFDLEIVDASDPATVFRTGEGDAMLTFWSGFANMRNADVGITAVAPMTTWVNNIVAAEGSGIKDVGDLEGKRLATLGATSMDWFILKTYAAQEFDLDVESDVEIVDAGSPALAQGLLEKGDVEATQMWFNLVPPLTASGDNTTIATMAEMAEAIGLPLGAHLMFGFRDSYIDENPENVEAFVRAYEEAVGVMLEDDEVWPGIAANIGITEADQVIELREITRPVLLSRFADDAEEQLQLMGDILIPLVGPENLGFDELPDGIITLEFQK